MAGAVARFIVKNNTTIQHYSLFTVPYLDVPVEARRFDVPAIYTIGRPI